MPRGNKAPFKHYEGRKSKDKHIRLTKDMLNSKAYLSLSNTAKVLYNYMKLWASGEQEFDYSKSLGSKIVSPATYTNNIKELVDKGFIERVYISTGGGHKPNRYKFSSNWQYK